MARFALTVWLTLAAAGATMATIHPVSGAEETPLTRIAFGSCAHQDKPQPLWHAILAYRPELFVFAGDNVYGDDSSPDLAKLKAAYAKAAEIEGQAELRRSAVVLATWDDHDYGANDGGADYAHKAAAQQVFAEFWAIPKDDPRWSREGVYHAEIHGPVGQRVQIILLDTRSFRAPLRPTDEWNAPGKEHYMPDPDPAKTMLGEAQWRWLRAQLEQPAELRLIVSSVQVLAEGHGFERWANLPLERQKLFDLIAEVGATDVVLLSGDRHFGALYHRSAGTPNGLHEITSSGINMVYGTAREPGPLRLGDVYRAENFGSIDIDWAARQATLSVRGMDGAPVRQTVIPIAHPPAE